MQNIDGCFAVFYKTLAIAGIIGVHMRILHIIVDPNALDQIQWCRRMCIKRRKGMIKGCVLYAINTDNVRTHLMDLLKPTQISGFVDFIIG